MSDQWLDWLARVQQAVAPRLPPLTWHTPSPAVVLTASPAEVYLLPPVRCATHGQMSPAPDGAGWVCHGWDGEGCDYVMTAGDVMRTAQYAGTTDGPVTWTVDADPPERTITDALDRERGGPDAADR